MIRIVHADLDHLLLPSIAVVVPGPSFLTEAGAGHSSSGITMLVSPYRSSHPRTMRDLTYLSRPSSAASRFWSKPTTASPSITVTGVDAKPSRIKSSKAAGSSLTFRD